MFKILFKRLFVLVAIFSILLFFFIIGKSLELSKITYKARVNIQNDIYTNASRTFGDIFIPNSFKPALKRSTTTFLNNSLGELGVEVVLKNLREAEREKKEDLKEKYGINQFLSEKISLHRVLKDPRPP